MSEAEGKIRAKVKCCACEGSLKLSKHLNLVCLDKLATWKYPMWGNILVMDRHPMNRASAILCDRCIEKKRVPRFAVEWSSDYKIVRYHKVEDLQGLPQIHLKEVLEAEGVELCQPIDQDELQAMDELDEEWVKAWKNAVKE